MEMSACKTRKQKKVSNEWLVSRSQQKEAPCGTYFLHSGWEGCQHFTCRGDAVTSNIFELSDSESVRPADVCCLHQYVCQWSGMIKPAVIIYWKPTWVIPPRRRYVKANKRESHPPLFSFNLNKSPAVGSSSSSASLIDGYPPGKAGSTLRVIWFY